MIINIPLQIDDEMIGKAAIADYENKVSRYLLNHVEDVLKQKAFSSWRSEAKPEEGIRNYVVGIIEQTIEKYRDDIIDAAAKELAGRLARTKRGKEILEGIAE